jgi:cytochrome c oxidase subunit 2
VGGLVLLGILLGGCKLPTFYGYRGVTSQSHDESLLYEGTVIAAIVVGVITGSLILWSALRYRRKTDAIPRQFQYHIPLEIFYTVVPIVIVLALFGFTVYTENKIDKVVPNPALDIRVTAFQWGWRYDYTNYHVFVEGVRTEDPDPVGLDGKTCVQSAPTPNDCLGPGLVMPVGETVRITLLSNDVVHGFYVPQFNFSRYALPGVVNEFDFNIQKPGIYRAQCTQLCGLYHAEMFFHVVALPRAQFLAWVHGSQPQPITDAGPVPTAAQSAKAIVPASPSVTTKSSVAS